jgi:hypothetical protein
MEEVLLRFSHLAEKIYGGLNNQSVVKCEEVSLQWNHFLKTNKAYNWLVIKEYTDCSDTLMKKLAKNAEDAAQITSDLQDIFKQFPTGTRQSSSFLMKWRSSPLQVAAENGYLKAYCLIMENYIIKQNGCKICESILEIIKGNILADENFLIRKMFFEKTIYDWIPRHFATANSHVKNCKIIDDFFSKNHLGMRSLSPMLNQVLDKAESTAAADATNPEQPAAKKLKTTKETAICPLCLRHHKKGTMSVACLWYSP